MPHTRMLLISVGIFLLFLALAFATNSEGWGVGAAVFGFVSIVLAVLWVPIEILRRVFVAREHRKSEALPEPLIKTSSSGDRYARARPSRPHRVLAFLTALVLPVPALFSGSIPEMSVGAAGLALACRVVFVMDVRVDASGIRLRRLFRTITISVDEVIAVRKRPSQVIFGPDFEPFELHLDEDTRFAAAANELLTIVHPDVDDSVFNLALLCQSRRSASLLDSVRMLAFAAMLVYLSGLAVAEAAFGLQPQPSPAWLLPGGVLATFVSSWFLRYALRRYLANRDWAPYGAQIATELERPESEPLSPFQPRGQPLDSKRIRRAAVRRQFERAPPEG